jgi:hypothetical protein
MTAATKPGRWWPWSRTPKQSSGQAEQQPGLAAVLGPSGVESTPRYLKVGDGYVATLIVTGYPPDVGMAWLDPLLSWPGRLDVVEHIDPLPQATAARRLRQQRARLESVRRADADKGRLADPVTEAAADDAADLADRVARGASRLHRVGHYLCVHAPTEDDLTEAVAQVRAVAASVLLDTQPATWRQLQAWLSTLPLGADMLRMRRVFDSDALAAAFPLASADLPAPLPGQTMPTGGVLYGLNTASNGVVWWNRWAQDNHNSVVLARSGSGKSYLVKLETLRCPVHSDPVGVDPLLVFEPQCSGREVVQVNAAPVPIDAVLIGQPVTPRAAHVGCQDRHPSTQQVLVEAVVEIGWSVLPGRATVDGDQHAGRLRPRSRPVECQRSRNSPVAGV